MAEEAVGEFHDWEVVHDSSESDSVISTDSFRDLEGFEGESQGMIQVDYFSLDISNCLKINSIDHGSIESDGIVIAKEPLEVGSASSSDRSDFEGNNEMSSVRNGKELVGFEGIGELNSPKNELGSVGNGKTLPGLEGVGEMNSPEKELDFTGNGKNVVGFEEIAEMGSKGEFSLTKNESGFVGTGENEAGFKGIEPQSLEFSEIEQGSGMDEGIYVNSDVGDEISAGENDFPSGEQINTPMEVVKAAGEGEKKSVVWWKVPFELLRFCAFRVSPVWTFSMAAAVMGMIMLTRRLYTMKKKSRALQLKVSMNDKKVSQFMSRAARLNEAFSVVKRVPVIRPALPTAGGLNQWPVMNLR